MLQETLETTFREQRLQLIWMLRTRYEVLTDAECEDFTQFAFMQAMRMLKKPDFALTTTWKPWLRSVAIHAALSHLRRHEERSLEALAAESVADGSSESGPQAISDRGALTPSQLLELAERGERRRRLVSDLLSDYRRHVETYQMWTQAEIFERSLRGQDVPLIAKEMRLVPQRIYEHRFRAFAWLRTQCDERDSRGSILASAFQPTPAREPATESPYQPRRMVDVIRWAVDTVGALCPSPARLAVGGSDVDYHHRSARWVADRASVDPLSAPGCRLCRATLADAAEDGATTAWS
jgi:DNA-directed RNA polymerase specialized sigma24 family protein